MISGTEVSFAYAGDYAVRDVTVSTPAQQVLGIVGPNGSGKTTLLHLLSGSRAPMRGMVTIDGVPTTSLKPKDIALSIAMVVQEREAAPGLTVAEMVMLGRTPHLRDFERAGVRDREIVALALDHVDLLSRARQSFVGLSGGERQRALIARALAQDTPYLFLDEPTNHLDIRFQHEVLDLIRGLDKTVVVVLHDLNLAARYCDQLIMIHEGSVIAHGTPGEVLSTGRIEDAYRIGAERIETSSGLHLLFHPLLPAETRHP